VNWNYDVGYIVDDNCVPNSIGEAVWTW